jgi:hypothetical protein
MKEHWARHEFRRKDTNTESMCGLQNVSMVFINEDGEADCLRCLKIWSQAQHDRDLETLNTQVGFYD